MDVSRENQINARLKELEDERKNLLLELKEIKPLSFCREMLVINQEPRQ